MEKKKREFALIFYISSRTLELTFVSLVCLLKIKFKIFIEIRIDLFKLRIDVLARNLPEDNKSFE